MKNKSIIVLVLAVAIVGGIYLVMSQKSNTLPLEKVVVKVGYIDLPTPIFIAKEKGYFEKANLDVQLQKFSNSNLLIEALERGELDATAPIGYSTLFAFENRKSGAFKVYGGYSENQTTRWSAVVTKKGGGISAAENLKGKKIVIASGKSPKSQAELVVRGFGLKTSDVEFVAVDRNLILPTFAKEEISAFIGTEPTIALLTEKANGTVFISSPRVKYIQDPYPTAGAVLSSTFLQTKVRVANDFVQAVNSAIDFIGTNEGESRKIFGKYLELEDVIALKMGLPKFERATEIDKAAVEKLADAEVANKILDKKPDVASFFLAN